MRRTRQEQRERLRGPGAVLRSAFAAAGGSSNHSEAGSTVVTHPAHDCWAAAELLDADAGIRRPGELYGRPGKNGTSGWRHRHGERVAAAAGAAARARGVDGLAGKRLTHSRDVGQI